jgi:hypothetical protein
LGFGGSKRNKNKINSPFCNIKGIDIFKVDEKSIKKMKRL